MRQASQASKTRVLRFKEPLSVCTDQFCRIGRAEPHNPAGISAHATHKQHRPRFYTAWTQSGHSLTLASTANKGTGTIGRFVRRNVYYLQNEH